MPEYTRPIDMLEAEMKDRLAAKDADIAKLKAEIARLKADNKEMQSELSEISNRAQSRW